MPGYSEGAVGEMIRGQRFFRRAFATEPLPAILYVCGHGGVKKGGVSL